MATWQPIATAPKDGTYILAVRSKSAGRMIIVAWNNETGDPDIDDVGAWNDGEYTYSPSHWMPLPDPPQEDN